jgi:hypothetical protein
MFIGKVTINEQFSIAILFYQRVMMMMIDIMIYIYNDGHMMGNKIVMVLIIFYYGISVPNPKM